MLCAPFMSDQPVKIGKEVIVVVPFFASKLLKCNESTLTTAGCKQTVPDSLVQMHKSGAVG